MELNPVVLPIDPRKPHTWPEDWHQAADSAKHALRCEQVELISLTFQPEYGAPVARYKDGVYFTASYPTGNHFVELLFSNPEEPHKTYRIRERIGILP